MYVMCVAWLSVDSAPQSMVLSSCIIIYYRCLLMFAGLKLNVHCFVCSRCRDQIRGSFYEDKHTGKSLCTDCHQVIIPKVDTYQYYLLQMINVGKQREMFRVSESNCGTLSHSQREQTASRMLQVCLLACS